MNINTIRSIIETKYSIKEISKVLFSTSGAISFISALWLMHKQIATLTSHIGILNKKLEHLENALQDKDNQIKTLIANQDALPDSGPMVAVVDSDVLYAQNEMIQFYLKAAGVAVIAVGILYVLSSISSLQWFSLKKILPAGVYSFIQDTTPFCQTKVTYRHVDTDHNSWLVHVINDKNLDILIKPETSLDFVRATQYLSELNSKAGTLVQTVSKTSDALVVTASTSPTFTTTAAATEHLAGLI
jgi:hypothetical protein